MIPVIGQSMEGFKLISKEKVNEINSTSWIFLHEKSGAKLMFLQNEEDNKVFSIAFRTPPEDSTGVAHILEHSVLCGSRKFPVKEPFVELIKGSLNTFLNAMTFSDKTMYPVASRNEKDFYNLMDVYLDAVFYPNIHEVPEIMLQEGWHYHIEKPEDEITIKGVVYNEMKGAFSSPEGILMRKIQESLFPDTPYGVESGGDPEVIPNLTQEQFNSFHKKYYHPSNSYIYLYGNMDMEKTLKFINDNYLSAFDKLEIHSEIGLQKPFENMRTMLVDYPVSSNEKLEDKTFMSLNFCTGSSTNPEEYLALDILEHLLLETPASPLKKALLEAKLGKDVFGIYDNSIRQPYLGVVVKNSNEAEAETFKTVVMDCLRDLVNKGIDKKMLESVINIKEFALREADYSGYPKGLVYHIKTMDSWLYDSDPNMHLKYENILKTIKQGAKERYFEELIEKYILKNPHSSMVIVRPARGIEERKSEEMRQKLSAFKASLSKEQLLDLVKNTEKLLSRQNAPDSKEALESIPLLSLEDINKNIEVLPIEDRSIKGSKLLYHDVFTSGIAYINLYFDGAVLPEELIPYGSLLCYCLGKVATDKRSYEDLSQEINLHTGGINFNLRAFSAAYADERYYPKAVVSSKVMVEKLPRLMELLAELLSDSNFEDTSRLKEIIMEVRSRMEMGIIQAGHRIAANHTLSYFSPVGAYEEKVKGLDFYKFVEGLEKSFEERAIDISDKLKKTMSYLFNTHNLIIGVTIDRAEYHKVEEVLPTLLSKLGKVIHPKQSYVLNPVNKNEGLITSSKVQYCAKAYNFIRMGYEYSGVLQVVRTIGSLDYLWNIVRVKGGAYGCSASFSRNGNMFMTSYRDPNLSDTFKAYDEMANYLEAFEPDEREMTKYIIGTISDLDSPLSPAMKGEVSDARYISGITEENLQKERDEVLSANVDKIRGAAALIRDCMAKNYVCVIGSEEKLKKEKDLFEVLIDLFE